MTAKTNNNNKNQSPVKSEERKPSLFAKCFGNAEVVYCKETTDTLTDMAGTFLVFCFAVYFTCAGYFLYREVALHGL